MLMFNILFAGGFLMLSAPKNEPPTTSAGPATRLRGSPLKSQLLSKFEDYNDSGYGGSPLPGNNLFIPLNGYFLLF